MLGEVVVNARAQPLAGVCRISRFHYLAKDLAHLFFHRVAMLGGALPQPIAHGVVEVADREGGHGADVVSSAVIASDGYGLGLPEGLLDPCLGFPMGMPSPSYGIDQGDKAFSMIFIEASLG